MPSVYCYIDDETYKRLVEIERTEGVTINQVCESLISEGVLTAIKRDDRYRHLLRGS